MSEAAVRRSESRALLSVPVVSRVRSLASATGDRVLTETALRFEKNPADCDRVSSALMDYFRRSRHAEAYTLLYELNQERFHRAILRLMAGMRTLADPNDVLQEVFVNIYRYPDRFRWECDASFRHWTHTIVRNTLLKQIRKTSRVETESEGFDLLASAREIDPLEEAADQEDRETGRKAYLLYLHLYMRAYNALSPKERRALHLVEVIGIPYREAAERLGIKPENFKMMIFRSRRKIFRNIEDALGGFHRG